MAKKYIDAEKLYKQVDELMARFAKLEKEAEPDTEDLSIFYEGKKKMCSELLDIIDSLQKEQPEKNEEPKHTEVWVEGRTIFEQDVKKPEVDLEKEIDMFFDGWSIDEDLGLVDDEGWSVTVGDIKNVARHFYELGRKGNKELNNKSKSSNDSDMGSPWRNHIIEEL